MTRPVTLKATPTPDLMRRYINLELAMETSTDGDEYAHCAAVLGDYAAELLARGCILPDPATYNRGDI